MKWEEWKILYNTYTGMEKKAVDLLSREAGKYLIREEGVYTLYVLPCEQEGAPHSKNAIILGLYDRSTLVRQYVGEDEVEENGFLIKVMKDPACAEGRLVILTARDEQELFYAAVSFLDDYLPTHAPAFGAVRMPQQIFDAPLEEYRYREHASHKTRSIFTWGHPINDYRAYIDTMARAKLNQLIIWNDHVPVNVRDVIAYAHSYGIEILFGYAWGWIDGCNQITDISDARLQELKEQVIRHYETHYADIGCDGIYFQSFTERHDAYIGGRLIAEAVTTFVNDTAEALLQKYPRLKLQFGLHALSVHDHLDEIAKVDQRVEILWEDCGVFPYHYLPEVHSEEEFEKTLDFTRKILTLRGKEAPVGLVFKGMMVLDWTRFAYQRGPFVLGNNAPEVTAHDRRLRTGGWRVFSAEWMQYGHYAQRMLQFIAENALGDVNMCMAGAFDGGMYFPYAICAQMFRTADGTYGEIMNRVARREHVLLG